MGGALLPGQGLRGYDLASSGRSTRWCCPRHEQALAAGLLHVKLQLPQLPEVVVAASSARRLVGLWLLASLLSRGDRRSGGWVLLPALASEQGLDVDIVLAVGVAIDDRLLLLSEVLSIQVAVKGQSGRDVPHVLLVAIACQLDVVEMILVGAGDRADVCCCAIRERGQLIRKSMCPYSL